MLDATTDNTRTMQAGVQPLGADSNARANTEQAQPQNGVPAAGGDQNGMSRLTGQQTQPAANTMSRSAPQAQPQTFAQMQAAGMARPAPGMARPAPQAGQTRGQPAAVAPMPARQPAAGGNTLAALVQRLVDNPNAYGSEQAQATFDRMRGQLQRGFDDRRRNLDETMAARGMYGSTVESDSMRRLARDQDTAESDLIAQITERQALAEREGLMSAIQASMGLRGQDQEFANADRAAAQRDQELALARMRMEQDGGQFNMDLALRRQLGLGGLDLQREGMALDRERFASDRDFRERGFTYQQGRDATDDRFRQGEIDYRRGRDTINDERFFDERTYSRGRDAESDRRWSADDAYRREMDRLDREYRTGRDAITDTRFTEDRDYGRGRDRVSDERWQREFDRSGRTIDDQLMMEYARMLGLDRFLGAGGRLPVNMGPATPTGGGSRPSAEFFV